MLSLSLQLSLYGFQLVLFHGDLLLPLLGSIILGFQVFVEVHSHFLGSEVLSSREFSLSISSDLGLLLGGQETRRNCSPFRSLSILTSSVFVQLLFLELSSGL